MVMAQAYTEKRQKEAEETREHENRGGVLLRKEVVDVDDDEIVGSDLHDDHNPALTHE